MGPARHLAFVAGWGSLLAAIISGLVIDHQFFLATAAFFGGLVVQAVLSRIILNGTNR